MREVDTDRECGGVGAKDSEGEGDGEGEAAARRDRGGGGGKVAREKVVFPCYGWLGLDLGEEGETVTLRPVGVRESERLDASVSRRAVMGVVAENGGAVGRGENGGDDEEGGWGGEDGRGKGGEEGWLERETERWREKKKVVERGWVVNKEWEECVGQEALLASRCVHM